MANAMSEKPHSLTTMWESIRSFSVSQKSRDYMPLGPLSTISFSTRYRTAIKIGVAVGILALLAVLITPLHPVDTARNYGLLHPIADHDPIPSIVHFVYLKGGRKPSIRFSFSSFLSVYASILHIKPTKVYIHSDYNPSEIEHAARTGDRWTRKLIRTWPELVIWNPVQVPNFAGPNEDHRVSALQHKSDFIRWDTIAELGGIYMDFDVITLKPLTPLLNAGFAFIAGRQYGGKDEGGNINGTINNGAFLTKPQSAMATIIKRQQHAGFNGAWEANLKSITKTAEYLVNIPNQVLILDRHAFAPTHWFWDSTDPLFLPNKGPSSPEPLQSNSTDPLEMYDSIVKNRRARRDWEMDFSASYMLHAFGTSGYQQYINPRAVLSRRSNFGIATYAIVKAMVAEGLIEGTEGPEWADS
ncbi:hypothetical protein N0V83_009748 [Neocucurbitaria cava]|uniref:Glycosyl transferase n=1 Tax=Neocucurbitaria cava TaxID=798079 RepID=A0A9W8XZX3_9PLEO|nr:hypothetical protein N0V83_009748 [Neocucurbitaria cava]